MFIGIVHKGQKRKTSEDFTDHLQAVRKLVSEAGIRDQYILDAALLHDTLEDGNITKEYLALRFGGKIAEIVDTLSKDDIWLTDYTKMKSNLDALELAWMRYPEATLIKIADRIHNLRTIHGFSPKKQLEYLHETTAYLLPLFQRILQQVNLGKLRHPVEHLVNTLEQDIKMIKNRKQ